MLLRCKKKYQLGMEQEEEATLYRCRFKSFFITVFLLRYEKDVQLGKRGKRA
jgi:hypothetical protein